MSFKKGALEEAVRVEMRETARLTAKRIMGEVLFEATRRDKWIAQRNSELKELGQLASQLEVAYDKGDADGVKKVEAALSSYRGSGHGPNPKLYSE